MGKNEDFKIKSMKIKNFVELSGVLLALITVIISVITTFRAKETVSEIKDIYVDQVQTFSATITDIQVQNTDLLVELDSFQSQIQVLNSELVSIQTQYQTVQTMIDQQQSVDVIQARDNDVLIMTPDGKWLVIPMIEKNDIEFSSEIIEKQYNSGELSDIERIDLFKDEEDSWENRDSFTYTLPILTINQNKMLSLFQFINKIDVVFNLYNTDQIELFSYVENVYTVGDETDYLNVFQNITPGVQFVTKQINDGIEDIKISIVIELLINGSIHRLQYNFDDFITVNPDI